MYFFMQGTKTTPHTLINDGYMKLKGKVVPIEEQQFFGRLSSQVKKYGEEQANLTNIEFHLSHLNASSKRSMVELLKLLETINNNGVEIVISWKYSSDNEDLKELGEIFQSMFDLRFELIPG